jgi:hypothetical protein
MANSESLSLTALVTPATLAEVSLGVDLDRVTLLHNVPLPNVALGRVASPGLVRATITVSEPYNRFFVV